MRCSRNRGLIIRCCNMKKLFLFVWCMAICTACHKKTFDDIVTEEVERFNAKEAPKRLDMYTTFDSMAYDIDEQTLSYYYTIEGELDSDLFPTELVKEELKNNLSSSLQLKAHKERGLNFHYKYLSKKTGETKVECTFTREDYAPQSPNKPI